jgi:glutamyl-tRNA synthetase
MEPGSPVGRLAPSPTGLLHLGHARSFLLAWWSARAAGGRVVLRLEDLDRARARPELVATCLADLRWLGLDWDGEPLVQSADPAPYERALTRLLADGRAYACVCSRAEVAAAGAPHAEDGELRYPGTCRGRFPDLAAARAASGRPAGVRLAVPGGELVVEDALRGGVAFDVQAEVGDFLLVRRDGVPAYQLAVVVDDARQGVTEVVRGDDLLPSAARQAWLQRLLGLPTPRQAHVPLVVGPDSLRLAKRRGALALAELRAEGVDPARVLAWAAEGLGLDGPRPGKVPSGFELGRVPRAPAILDDAALARIRGARA